MLYGNLWTQDTNEPRADSEHSETGEAELAIYGLRAAARPTQRLRPAPAPYGAWSKYGRALWERGTDMVMEISVSVQPQCGCRCSVTIFEFTSATHGPDDWVSMMRDYYGPTMNAYDAARASGNEAELHRQLAELTHSHNHAVGNGTRVRATYLRVTVDV